MKQRHITRPCVESIESRMLLSAGQLDLTFGDDGIATTLIAGGTSALSDMQSLPDGRIIAAGTWTNSTGSHVVLARFLQDGSPDPTFGGTSGAAAGVVITSILGAPGRLELIDKGRILFYNSSQLIQFNGDGSIDPKFTPSSFNSFKYSFNLVDVDVQADGKILLAGTYREGGGGRRSHFAVARLRPNGVRDHGFGWGGVSDYYQLIAGSAKAVRAMPDGSIIAIGHINYGYWPNENSEFSKHDLISVKLRSDGMLDPTYAGSGIASTTAHVYISANSSSVIAPDGSATIALFGEGCSFYHYNPAGNLDHTLSINRSIGGNWLQTDAVRMQLNEVDLSLVATIDAERYDNSINHVMLRLTPGLAVDTTFGSGGVTRLRTDTQMGSVLHANDGSILTAVASGDGLTMARFWSSDAPAAEVHAPNLKHAGDAAYRFSIVVRDDVAVDQDSISSAAFTLLRPSGAALPLRIAGIRSIDKQSQYRIDFKVYGPGGAWGPEDNGVYEIQQNESLLGDVAGHRVQARPIGSFRVRISA